MIILADENIPFAEALFELSGLGAKISIAEPLDIRLQGVYLGNIRA